MADCFCLLGRCDLASTTALWNKIFALPVIAIRAPAGSKASAVKHQEWAPALVGVCLLFLLCFSTAVAFVKGAWAIQAFQIGIFAVVAGYLLWGLRPGEEYLAAGLAPKLVYLIPVWGVIQILAHTTSASFQTREEVLRWGALAGVFFLSQIAGCDRSAVRLLLNAFLIFATVMAVLCLTQLFTSQGNVLWMIPTGYPEVFGTFPSYDHYAQFVELALPIALWRALRDGWRSWWCGLAGGILYASVIASASRGGAALCTLELLAMVVLGFVKLRDPETGLPTRATTVTLVMIPVLAAGLTLAVGWDRVLLRFQENNQFLGRREFVVAAIDMAKHKPLAGFGLGTFPAVYQRYAIKDFPFYANHAHNDWVEFAADGGIPFLLLILVPFAAAIPTAVRNPWGLGLVAIMLHAIVDFPFPRTAVSAWMFFLLGLLYMTRTNHLLTQRALNPANRMERPARRIA